MIDVIINALYNYILMVTAESDFLKIEDSYAKTKDIQSICLVERTSHKDVLVTIAFPTYKGGEMLVRAVNSALAQEGYDDYNILIVDNNPQSTLSIEEFSSGNSEDRRTRISIYRNAENIGMCNNWNRCVTLCQSKYMVMLHTDDYIMPNYLKEVMEIVCRRPNAGIVQTARKGYSIRLLDNAKGKFERVHLLDIFPGGQLHAPSGMLMRTEYVRALGGWNNDHTDLFDYWFNALFLTRYPVYITSKKLTYYNFDLGKYPPSVKYNLTVAEYYLWKQALAYCHMPKKISQVCTNELAKSLCRVFELQPEKLPFKLVDYNKHVATWSRRFVKYTSLAIHACVNIKDVIV